jgi:Predicted hydrolase of the alpha/beta superfamily
MSQPLAARLALPSVIPAAVLDLPPHKGRESRHLVLKAPCDSHRIEILDLPEVRHPLAAPDAAPYRIFRAVPRGMPPASGWPVLYLLDGNAAFDFLSAADLAQVPGLVLIGIGQDTRGQFERLSRARDLTFPKPGQVGLIPDAGYGDRPTGGAPEFLPLLTGDLREHSEDGIRIDATRRTLWGHSLGGLFVLNVMLRAPESFARYAAISPSLWWNPERFTPVMEAALSMPMPETALPLYMGVGSREQRTGSDGPPPDGPPEAFMALVSRLAETGRFDLMTQIYEGAMHIASLPSSLPATLSLAAA